MLKKKHALVVGTTSDYIDWIRQIYQGQVLFITDPEIRQKANEKRPLPNEEILYSLSDFQDVLMHLEKHLFKWKITLKGIACFDCESMELASFIAEKKGLDYPSIAAIQNCRDKYVSKQIWQKQGIDCPEAVPINTISDVFLFTKGLRNGCVLKPFTGSGSELVFKCYNNDDCITAFHTISKELKKRTLNPIFKNPTSSGYLMLAEEMISGIEYSCDFIIDNTEIQIIRCTQKIKSFDSPFETIIGYIIPAVLPQNINAEHLKDILYQGAVSLGVTRGICMVDFFINDQKISLLEITPRPGGDCLPYLLKKSGNLDILKLSLDFACKQPLELMDWQSFTPSVGLRLFAHKAGVLKKINADQLDSDTRVKGIYITKKPGHIIKMPPDDYDSRLLGHIIIEPTTRYSEIQSITIAKQIEIEIMDIDTKQTKSSLL